MVSKLHFGRLVHQEKFSRSAAEHKLGNFEFQIAEVTLFQVSVLLVAIKSHQENKKLQICIAGNVERIQR
jgi:hypothetical protein